MHIGIIASLKKGFEHFIYREVCGLADQGATISIFPTKFRRGLYNPLPEWSVFRWRAWLVLLVQPWRFVQMPIRYLSTLWIAIQHRDIVDFFLAAYFAPDMRNVDVLYATFGDRKLFIGYFAKLLLGKPLAVEILAHELYQNPNPALFVVALGACDRIIAVTEYNREFLRDRFGIDPNRIQVVRLSIDLQEYRPEKKFVVLIVAFFVERKGHEILFNAVKKLGLKDIEVWVVGGIGAEIVPVDPAKMAVQAGIESQVAFFGKLSGPALKAVYHACDVFCLPSRHEADGCAEGFPTVLIEAMACGKPVVTTRHVEIPRIVEQVLVDENDVDGLADALRTVYASAKLREDLGRRSRELAEKHFTSGNLAQTITLLTEIALPTDTSVPGKKLNGSGALSLREDHGINGYANANGGTTGKTELVPVRTPVRRSDANQPTGVSS